VKRSRDAASVSSDLFEEVPEQQLPLLRRPVQFKEKT
jgi:hypothetical protein